MWPFGKAKAKAKAKDPDPEVERLRESIDVLGTQYMTLLRDIDEHGLRWNPLDSAGLLEERGTFLVARNLEDLRQYRRKAFRLHTANPFVIGATKVLETFVIGRGIRLFAAGQSLEDFVERTRWDRRCREMVLRMHRDGEFFLRRFSTADGVVVRFVEPALVGVPPGLHGRPEHGMGLHCEDGDVESVVGYHVMSPGSPPGDPASWEEVPADEVWHHKINVDSAAKRGMPTFLPATEPLEAAAALARNMGTSAAIQASIPYVEQVRGPATSTDIEDVIDGLKDYTVRDRVHGKTREYQVHRPGTIPVLNEGWELKNPTEALDGERYVAILQSLLREAGRLVCMPEWLFTGALDKSAYASTVVSEGPFARYLESQQDDLATEMRMVLREWLGIPGLMAEGEWPGARGKLEDTNRLQALYDRGIISMREWTAREGFQFEEQQGLLADEGGTKPPPRWADSEAENQGR
ncbi:MAG: phage portal protein, partial [Planctomycetota bacterium]